MFFLTIILFYSLIIFSYENGTGKKMGEFFDKILSLYNEPKISELELKSKEVFRLKYCERYCENHLFIRFERDKRKTILFVKGAPFYFYDSDKKTLLLKDFEAEINEKVWSNIKRKIDDYGFWKKKEIIKIDSKEKQIMGLPGSSYLLEGYKNNIYHFVYRRESDNDGKIKDLHDCFIKTIIEEYKNPDIKIITETPYLNKLPDSQKNSSNPVKIE
jgi:hypothetical protein